MGMPEIFLEHKNGEKQRYLRVKPNRSLFLIGSSAEADLRIGGEGIAGCHAALRFRAPHWYVCDISGTNALKVNDQFVTESVVDGSTRVEIGGHRLQLFTKERTAPLMKDNEGSQTSNSKLSLHQVVIRVRGKVAETRVLGANQPFTYNDGEKKRSLPAPTSGSWVKTEVGTRMIQQRLVTAQEMAEMDRIEIDRDLRKPLAIALAMLMFFIGTVALLGSRQAQTKEVVLDKKSMDIIFNAKAITKKKVESQKIVKAAKAKAGGTNQAAPVQKNVIAAAPEESQAPTKSPTSSRALTSLRQAGLSALVGKIAKRANKAGVMVATTGVSADNKGAGRAFYSTGTTTTGGGGSASKVGPSFRLGGVATGGKAGGVGNVKDGTALAGGSVGSGNIVALVDEETVVEGGLDKDAIAEVIRRNLGQIRYCYERQLSSNRDLYGKVLVKWMIGASGEVISPRVDTTTLKSAMVEGCILRRMASWKFPEPKGGTQVNVAYPFLFKALD
jgi:outer membrane biosynthesis protein TonB